MSEWHNRLAKPLPGPLLTRAQCSEGRIERQPFSIITSDVFTIKSMPLSSNY